MDGRSLGGGQVRIAARSIRYFRVYERRCPAHADGDVAGARLAFRRLADEGEAAAALGLDKIVLQVYATIAKSEIEIVAELAEIPGRPLGEIDPARIDATVERSRAPSSLRGLLRRRTCTRSAAHRSRTATRTPSLRA